MKKGIEIKDIFEWTMKDELVQALEELDMTNPEVFEQIIDIEKIQQYWLELEGYGKKINGFGLVIPSVKDYNLFKEKMYNLEKNLLNKIDNT